MHKLFVSLLIALVQPFISSAKIIHNSNVNLSSPGYAGLLDYSLNIQQDVAETDVTYAFFDRSAAQLIYRGPSLDAGLDLSFANFGDPIPEPPLLPESSLIFDQSYDVGYTDFYLSFYADSVTFPDQIIGWAHLENTPSGLLLLENAIAYDGESMAVGVVPEPSTIALLIVSGSFLFLGRMKLKR